jgi:ketosteroid isomerase-like protein
MNSALHVVDRHIASFAAGDLDGILSDYAPEAVVFTPDGVLKSPASIRSLFVDLLAEFGKPGADFRLHSTDVHGDHAYILWAADTADHVYELATDTFFVRDGKIVVQSFAAKKTRR